MRLPFALAFGLMAFVGCAGEPTRREAQVLLPNASSAPAASAGVDPTRSPKLVELARQDGAPFTAVQETKWVVTSPKGDRYASGGGPAGAITLWDAATGKSLGVLEGSDVLAAAFSPDGTKLAAIVPRTGLVVFDVATLKAVRSEARQGNIVFALAFSPDGMRIATSDGDGAVELWSANGAIPRTKIAQYKRSAALAFSPSGKSLLVAADGEALDLWDVASANKTKTVLQSVAVRKLAFGPDDTTIVTAELDGKDNLVRIRDASTGAVKQTMRGHTSTVNAVAFSRDARTVASGSGDGTVRVWDASTGALLRKLSTDGQAVWALGFSANGERLVAAGQGQSLHAWNAATGAREGSPYRHANAISSLAYAPDAKTLVSGDATGQVFWRPASGGGFDVPARALKLDRFVRSMGFSADGARLYTVSNGGLQFWDATTHAAIRTLAIEPSCDVVFSPSETQFAVSDESRIVTLRDTKDGGVIRTFGEAQPHDDIRQNLMTPSGVSFAPDGRTIAIARWDQPVELWDTHTGKRVRSLEGTLRVAFSPDGKHLATGAGLISKRSPPASLKLVNVATGKLEHALDGEPEAAFLPGGAFVVGTRAGELRVWSVATGELVTHTPAPGVTAFTVSRDGSRIATGAADGTVIEWTTWGD